jgi:4-amino-4-deoxy-L-arabinose transferase-like glycosyltransferase
MNARTKLGIIVLFALAATVVVNEINLTFLEPHYPYKQGLITTADEYSYFSAAEQLLKTGEWNINSTGEKAYIRTPGYGIIYFVALALGGSHAFFVLKCIQLLFFAGSIVFFFRLSRLFTDEKISLLATAIYALLPCFSGFTYYTLSESVLPFFVLGWLYALMIRTERNQWLMLLFSTATLVMIRPQLIVFPLVMLGYYAIKREKAAFALLLGLLPFAAWQVRTMTIIGEWPGLHPIYSTNNNSLYRPPHQEMTDVFRIWEYRGDVFHGNMGLLSGDTTRLAREKVLQTVPKGYQKALEPILQEFQQFRWRQQSYAGKALHGYLPGEKQLIQNIRQVRDKLSEEHRVDNLILTPLKSFKQLVGTSMMNLYVFQAPDRQTWVVLGLKAISFGLILLGLLSGIWVLIRSKDPRLKLLSLAVFASMFYLSFFQRMNEERYLYPYLPVMLLFLVAAVKRWKGRLRRNSN